MKQNVAVKNRVKETPFPTALYPFSFFLSQVVSEQFLIIICRRQLRLQYALTAQVALNLSEAPAGCEYGI